MRDWNVQRSQTTNKKAKDSLKNKISALRHRMVLKEGREIDFNKDFQIKVFNLRLVLKILVNLSFSLSNAQIKRILEQLRLRISAVGKGVMDNVSMRFFVCELERYVWILN